MTTVAAFSSLYLATLLLLVGSGLFNTYLGLRLTAVSVSEVWVGALIAVYYLGLVFGARMGHKVIIQVGHIRAYAANAAIVTVSVLALALVDNLWVWLLFRFVALFVLQFFAEEVVRAVEARHYPEAATAARSLAFHEEMRNGVRSTLRALLVNLVAHGAPGVTRRRVA